MTSETEFIHLPSGRNLCVSTDVYANYYLNFSEYQDFYFNTLINSGLYFPQIMQFICVMICICNGCISLGDVLLCNLESGVLFTLAWFFLRLHKFIPGVCYLSCLIGGNLFRYKLHFIAIAAVSLFVIGDWKVILYCLLGGIVTGIARSLLVGLLSTVKYNDAAVIYAAKSRSNRCYENV